MFRFLLTLGIGFLAGYLFGSERAQAAARQRVANAPEPVRQVTDRISGAIAGAPVPDSWKQTASRATNSVQVAAARAADAAAPTPHIVRPSAAEISGRPAEPMPGARETPSA